MALGPEIAATDRPAEVQHGPSGKAEGAGAILGPDRRLQGKGIVVAGEPRQGGVAFAQVNRSQVENEFEIHDLEDLIPRICSQTHCVEWLRVLHGSG